MPLFFEDILIKFARKFEKLYETLYEAVIFRQFSSMHRQRQDMKFQKCWYFEKNDVSVIFYICTASAFLILSREGPRLHACRFAMFNIGLRNSSDERFQGFVCRTGQISSRPVRRQWITGIWRPSSVSLGSSAEGILSKMYVSWCTTDYPQ